MVTTQFTYQPVERLPKQLDAGVVYHSEEFEVAALSCACGCGHRVMLLVPDSHQVFNEHGLATIQPSISVCDAPCRSHYFITAGEVQWMAAFTPAMASATMQRQIARHVVDSKRRQSWSSRIWAAVVRGYKKLRAILGL